MLGHSHLLLALSSIPAALGTSIPALDAAQTNAARIFNSVHDAFRQWGSSVHHNGVAVLPVVVPAGSIFYHGCQLSERRTSGLEWLAFEPEHAAGFGRSREGDSRWPAPNPPEDANISTQQVFVPPESFVRGYFHTYRATRSLKLVYFDGMSAANMDVGTMDTQDRVVLDGWSGDDDYDDWIRADKICSLGKQSWGGLDGIVRMEAGFELIYCDFSEGLELVSLVGSPFSNETTGQANPRAPLGLFEWMRATAQRYDGFDPRRVEVDWSAMVSAFWYSGVNTTNLDVTRPELPGLASNLQSALRPIGKRIGEVFSQQRDPRAAIHWQAVTDRIVTFFGPRIDALSLPSASTATLRGQLDSIFNSFINFAKPRSTQNNTISACATRHLDEYRLQQNYWTTEDKMIFAALETVTTHICHELFEIRALLDPPREENKQSVKTRAERLVVWLDWARRRRCADNCESDGKLCFVSGFEQLRMERPLTVELRLRCFRLAHERITTRPAVRMRTRSSGAQDNLGIEGLRFAQI